MHAQRSLVCLCYSNINNGIHSCTPSICRILYSLLRTVCRVTGTCSTLVLLDQILGLSDCRFLAPSTSAHSPVVVAAKRSLCHWSAVTVLLLSLH